MKSIVEEIAKRLADAVLADSLQIGEKHINLFHRSVLKHESSDMSWALGTASTGLRTIAILDHTQLLSNYGHLVEASRNHIPLVAHIYNKQVKSSGSFWKNLEAIQSVELIQFVAYSKSEHIHLGIVAQAIAEQTLEPVVVYAAYDASDEDPAFPDDKLIKAFCGKAEDMVDCSTPAQEILFGTKRKRIPAWFSADHSVRIGVARSEEELGLEEAASDVFFSDHNHLLIGHTLKNYKSLTGYDIYPIESRGQGNMTFVGCGSIFGGAVNQADISSCRFITLRQLYPVSSELKEQLKEGGTVVAMDFSGSNLISQLLNKSVTGNTRLISGNYSSKFDGKLLDASVQYVQKPNAEQRFFAGIPLVKNDSKYPKQDVLIAEINKAYPLLKSITVGSDQQKSAPAVVRGSEMPELIKRYADKGPKYSQVSRFFNNEGVFHQMNAVDEIVASPYSAIPLTPPATAAFNSMNADSVPVVSSDKCTGCGSCFVYCPHAAIVPLAIGVEDLVKTGVKKATEAGHTIMKLTPVIKNMAKVAASVLKENSITDAGQLVSAVFNELAGKMNLSGDKLNELTAEIDHVAAALNGYSLTANDTFYFQAEAHSAGEGDLFSLSLNPSSCTGCGICAEVCYEDAIEITAASGSILEVAQQQFKMWEAMPDTKGSTVNRLYEATEYDSLSAILLSRNYFLSMSGPSEDKGQGTKAMLHAITAMVESVIQPRYVKTIASVEELIDGLTENIHNHLSGALPKENIEVLSKAFKQSAESKLSLQDIVNKLSDEEPSKLLDTKSLSRKTELIESLSGLNWLVGEGPSGTGRSRYGLFVSPTEELAWSAEYPYNNFTVPVMINWNTSSPEQVIGLFQGQIRSILDNVKLIRRAQLEVKDKYDPSAHDLDLSRLDWDDLTAEERELVPPLLLVSERQGLNKLGWNSLNKLLAGKWPIKVILFDTGISSPGTDFISDLAQTTSGLFSTISLKNAYVFQGGYADRNHFVNGMLDGIQRPYPAIFMVYAPSSNGHRVEVKDWEKLANMAADSRIFPGLRYDPGEKAGFLSGGISLDGNKAADQDWVKETIQVSEEEFVDYAITFADWAFLQKNWKNEFTPVDPAENQIDVSAYLKLDSGARNSKVPVIYRKSGESVKYYQVSEKIILMTDHVVANWNTLQEVAGLLTEFPLKLRENVLKELSVKFENDVQDLKEEHRIELERKEQEQNELLRQKLKEKLVALTAMAKNN